MDRILSDPPGSEAVSRALRNAEWRGFRLMLVSRNVAVALLCCWLAFGTWLSGNPVGIALGLAALVVGLVIQVAMGTSRERVWHRYGLLVFDIALLVIAALEAPLMRGADIPRIFVFRAYGIHYPAFLLFATALTLSPRYVLAAGGLLVAGYWIVYAIAVSQLETTLSWRDLAPGSSAQQYVDLVLDPRFVGLGNRIEETVVLALGTLVLAFAVSRARALVFTQAQADEKRRATQALFSRFVPPELAASLVADPDSTHAQLSDATAMHVDIEGFTTFSEGRDPVEVLTILDTFLERVGAAVSAERGVVVGFAGDAVLATFGAPVARGDHASRAVAAALAILEMMRTTRFGGQHLDVRIGLASGPLASGLVGSRSRQAYTVYGDTVNLAQRLEAANKFTGTRLLISAATYEAAGRPDDFRPLGEISVPGRDASPYVFALATHLTRPMTLGEATA